MNRDLRRGWRRHLSYPNVMSTLVVFLVLAGGTALAAGLPKNSVTSRTVKDNSLRSADLADGLGVTGADVADGSLGGADLADGTLSGIDVGEGSLKGADFADGSLAGGDIGMGALSAASIGAGAVDSSKVAVESIRGTDIGTGVLTGEHIIELTLSEVPSAARFDGRLPSAFLESVVRVHETQIQQGTGGGDGTFTISHTCQGSEVLIAGGPANVGPGSSVIENTPTGGVWTVKINSHGAADPFSVSVVCLDVNG